MADPYIGEIRLFAGNFAPVDWAFCNGQLLPISQNDALFALIGTTYGGDGQVTFALPDLRGRFAVHQGTGPGLSTYVIGSTGGAESVTVLQTQMPQHTHAAQATGRPGHLASPAGAFPAKHRDHRAYLSAGPGASSMQAGTVGVAGGSQPHENMPPYGCVSHIICLFGIFPSRA